MEIHHQKKRRKTLIGIRSRSNARSLMNVLRIAAVHAGSAWLNMSTS